MLFGAISPLIYTGDSFDSSVESPALGLAFFSSIKDIKHITGDHWSTLNHNKAQTKRGNKDCLQQMLRKQLRNSHIPLPTMILANVQSLRSKMDEMHLNVTYLCKYVSHGIHRDLA